MEQDQSLFQNLMKTSCECSDPGCPECKGKCTRAAVVAVLRVDMDDRTGTPVCRQCADDCLDSGLFRESVTAFLRYHKGLIPKRGAK